MDPTILDKKSASIGPDDDRVVPVLTKNNPRDNLNKVPSMEKKLLTPTMKTL